MKATCNVQYPILKGIFDKGDVVEIEPILSERREVLSTKREKYVRKDSRGNDYEGSIVVEEVVREKGSYMGYRIKSKNGQYYNDHNLYCAIGNKTLAEIFVK